MKTWGRKESNSSDEDSTAFGPKAPDPVLGQEDIDDDADTMTILAEGTRETFCPEPAKGNVEETPEESGWLPDCCNRNTTDDQASTFSSPTWFSGTADEKVVEAKATEFADSVEEVSREVNNGGPSDRALAAFDEDTEDSKEITNEDLPAEDDSESEDVAETVQRQASRSPSSERKKRGFAAILSGMFPGSSKRGESQEKTRALDLEEKDANGDEEAPKQETMKIVGVSDDSADDASYADKDDNTPEGTIDLIPLDTHDISASEDPETGIKTIDRDSETENASDLEEETKPHRRSARKRLCCLALFMILLTAGLLGIFRPGKIGEIGSVSSRSIEAGSAPEETPVDTVDGTDGETEVEPDDSTGGDREFPNMDVPDSEQSPEAPVDVDPEPEAEEPEAEEPEAEEPEAEEPEAEEPEAEEPEAEEPEAEEPEPEQPEAEEPEEPEQPEQEPEIAVIPPLSPEEEEDSTETISPPTPEYFAALSNTPYDGDSQAALVAQLAGVDAEFIVHVGNVRSDSPDCLYEDYQLAAETLLSSDAPVFMVPGPNDWSVCNDPVAAYDNYVTFFTEFTEANWGVRRVRRHPRNSKTFSWRYSDDIQILGVDLVAADEDELSSKIQETVAWTRAAFRNFDGTRVFVFAYSTPQEFVERLEQELHAGLSITYVNGVDAASFGPLAYKVSALPVLIEL